MTSPGNPYAPPFVDGLAPVLGGDGGHEEIYRNLSRAVLGQEPLVASGRDAAKTLELANAIIYSSWTAEPVSLPIDRTAYASFLEARRSASGKGE